MPLTGFLPAWSLSQVVVGCVIDSSATARGGPAPLFTAAVGFSPYVEADLGLRRGFEWGTEAPPSHGGGHHYWVCGWLALLPSALDPGGSADSYLPVKRYDGLRVSSARGA